MKKLALYALASIALAGAIHADAYAQLQSQVVAGSDNGTTRRILKTDNTGRLEVVGAAAGGVAYGPDLPNVVPSQAPNMQACFGSTAGPTAVTTGRVQYVWCDLTGRLNVNAVVSGTASVTQSGVWTNTVTQATAANLNAAVVGSVAAAATDSGNPVKIGGVYNTTLPTYTTGQRTDLQVGSRGSLNTTLFTQDGTNAVYSTTAGQDAMSNGRATIFVTNWNEIFNGTSWDRARSIEGATAATGVAAVSYTPNASANAGIVPVISTALENGHVLKASAGNFYRLRVTPTIAGYVIVTNATTVQADGATVGLLSCTQVGATTTEIDNGQLPIAASTGITAIFSTTGCYTVTKSASAHFEGFVK